MKKKADSGQQLEAFPGADFSAESLCVGCGKPTETLGNLHCETCVAPLVEGEMAYQARVMFSRQQHPKSYVLEADRRSEAAIRKGLRGKGRRKAAAKHRDSASE